MMSDLNKKTAGKYLFKLMYSDWVVEVSIKRAALSLYYVLK